MIIRYTWTLRVNTVAPDERPHCLRDGPTLQWRSRSWKDMTYYRGLNSYQYYFGGVP